MWVCHAPPQPLKVGPCGLPASQPAPLRVPVKFRALCPLGRALASTAKGSLRAPRPRQPLWKWGAHAAANASHRPSQALWHHCRPASRKAVSKSAFPKPNRCCFSLKRSDFRRSLLAMLTSTHLVIMRVSPQHHRHEVNK